MGRELSLAFLEHDPGLPAEAGLVFQARSSRSWKIQMLSWLGTFGLSLAWNTEPKVPGTGSII